MQQAVLSESKWTFVSQNADDTRLESGVYSMSTTLYSQKYSRHDMINPAFTASSNGD